jgi:hypothetical protein
MRYLLPCQCGRQIPISTSQAGETLTCECGQSQTAPKLRELRQLPLAGYEEPARSGLAWSRKQGMLFAGGLAILLLAAITLAITTLQRRTLHTEAPTIAPERMDDFLAEIDRNTPLQNLEVWKKEILEEGLEREGDPRYVTERRIAGVLHGIMLAAGAGAVVGLGMIIASFIVRSEPATSPHKAKV